MFAGVGSWPVVGRAAPAGQAPLAPSQRKCIAFRFALQPFSATATIPISSQRSAIKLINVAEAEVALPQSLTQLEVTQPALEK